MAVKISQRRPVLRRYSPGRIQAVLPPDPGPLEGNTAGYGPAHGYAYDDVGDFRPSLHTPALTTVIYTFGW